jgi:L-threonylcarbamoyladenylate synthase
MVLDGGSCANGIESTIIGFKNDEPIIYRLGALPLEAIEAVIGKVFIKNKKEENPDAPGMLARHYAPKTTTFLVADVLSEVKKHSGKKIGILVFKSSLNDKNITEIVLSKEGSMQKAASNLYAAMHKLDSENLDIIIAERFPDVGLGNSINDRLQRATFK